MQVSYRILYPFLLLGCIPTTKHKSDIPKTGNTGTMAPAQSQAADETEASPIPSENMDKSSTPGAPNPPPVKTLKFATQSCEKNPVTGAQVHGRTSPLLGI